MRQKTSNVSAGRQTHLKGQILTHCKHCVCFVDVFLKRVQKAHFSYSTPRARRTSTSKCSRIGIEGSCGPSDRPRGETRSDAQAMDRGESRKSAPKAVGQTLSSSSEGLTAFA